MSAGVGRERTDWSAWPSRPEPPVTRHTGSWDVSTLAEEEIAILVRRKEKEKKGRRATKVERGEGREKKEGEDRGEREDREVLYFGERERKMERGSLEEKESKRGRGGCGRKRGRDKWHVGGVSQPGKLGRMSGRRRRTQGRRKEK